MVCDKLKSLILDDVVFVSGTVVKTSMRGRIKIKKYLRKPFFVGMNYDDGLGNIGLGHKVIKINFCPFCGERISVAKIKKVMNDG